MPQQHADALCDCATAATPTTSVTIAATAATIQQQIHCMPTATVCRTLSLALALFCLLSAVTCELAPAALHGANPASAPPLRNPLSTGGGERPLIQPYQRFKRAPYIASDHPADRSSTAATTDVDYDYYGSEEVAVEAGNGHENVSGRQRRHQRLSSTSPPARFGYDGAKIKPQQFYAREMLVNNLPGGDGGGSSKVLNAPLAARVTNDLSVWSLRGHEKRTNICDVCVCTGTSFVAISCDYNKRNSKNTQLSDILGNNYSVPPTAKNITIKLAPKTHLRLEKELFVNNSRMNSFTINGSYRDGEQVEINTGAFPGGDDTIGPYPEIVMQDVFSVVVREGAFSGDIKFAVRNSNDLILYSNAFKKAQISGSFVSVADLRIEEKAFNSANATLHIENSHIDNIYRFEASLHEIKFNNCSIGTINSGSFDVNYINSIVFVNSRIDVIKSRAITEKLLSEHVSFIGGVIGYIEGEAIHGSGINELIFRNNRIDIIHDNAIHVNAINATIADNVIMRLGQNWLRVKEWSRIVIERNVFGDFRGIILEETKKPGICRFQNNSVTKPHRGSLNITNRHCVMREISVKSPCRCNRDWLDELSDRDLRSEIYCAIDTKLGVCFNATSFNMLKYENEVCDETKTTLDCGANRNLKKVDGKFFTLEELEHQDSEMTLYICIAAITFLTLAVVIILALVLRYFCGQKHGSGGGSLGHHHSHEFTQNERHIVERALQLIQKRYPHIHARVERLCQELLQTNRTEKQCITTVTKIENLLSKVERSEDLYAFCSVLAQHLQPQSPPFPHTLEAVYSTDSISQVQRENYDGPLYAVGCIDTSHTVVSMEAARIEREREHEREREYDRERASNALNSRNAEPLNVPNEPFYEELGQPLLPDYASPADRRDYATPLDQATGLGAELEYAEPINNRADTAQRLPPYAPPQTSNSNKLPNRPSTLVPTAAPRTRLPPINNNNNSHHPLYQGVNKKPTHSSSCLSGAGGDNRPALPPSNVKRMAHELQNMPNFHLPNAGLRPPNLHLVAPPVYTSPGVSHKRPTPTPASTFARLATPEVDESEFDMRGAVALPPDTGSNHSGGSNETVKIDDVIMYADA